MAQPIADLLSRLTPDVSGLDRDGLLYAAGRASARTDRRWIVLTASLAVSQLGTLVVVALLAAPPRPVPALPTPPAALPIYPEVAPAPTPVDLHTHWPGDGLRRLDQPGPAAIEDLVPDAPPLRAFTRTMPDLN